MAPGSPPAKVAGWDNPGDLFENPLVQGKQASGRPEQNGSGGSDGGGDEPPVDAAGGAGDTDDPADGHSAYEVETRRQAYTGKSLGLFSREGKFRQTCHTVRVSQELEYCVVTAAALNTVLLAVDSPAFPPVKYAAQVFWAEVLVTAFFTVEVCIRVVDRGFIKGPDAYLRVPINQIDFVVVVASIVALFVARSSALNALRSLRMFRLFPTISKLGTVRDIVEAVSESLVLFRDVVGLLLFGIFAFGVVGMNFFGGALSHRCEMVEEALGDGSSGSSGNGEPLSSSSLECPSMLSCDSLAGATGRCIQNDVPFAVSDKEFYGNHGFDHIGQGLLTVFVQMTCDGGMQDMAQILVHGVHGASTQSRVFAWPFFFILVVVCAWVVLSLFTAVLSAEFAAVSARTKLRKKQEQEAKELEALRQAPPAATSATFDVEFADAEVANSPRGVSPSRSSSSVQVKARQIADNVYFDAFIAVCIVLSVASLFNNSEGSPSVEKLLHQLDNFFIFVFFLEFVIKVAAYSWKGYWADGANRFDFVILIFTLGGFILAMSGDALGGNIETQSFLSLRLPRLLRLIRMMRFVFIIPSIRAIFQTVFSSWQKILSLCSFVVFMQVMFAVFGMQMFGGSLPQGTPVTECWGGPQWGGVPGATCGSSLEYTRRHFETFPVAFLTSFQYMTGEAWSQIMFWYGHHSAFGLPGAAFFFTALFLWQNCVSISLFVAIILDNFKLTEEEKTARQIELHEQEVKRAQGFSDPYVEVRLLQEHTWTHKQQQLSRTAVVKHSLDPIWTDNNRFKYEMVGRRATLVLTVMDWDLSSADDFLGEIRVEVTRQAGNFASPAAGRDSDIFENEQLSGEEYLSLKIASTYTNLDGEEQQKVDELTVAAGEEIDLEQQLQQGPDWEVEDPIQGRLYFSVMLEENNVAILSQEKRDHSNHAVFYITVTGATNLLADDSNIAKDSGGIIAQAFAGEFETSEAAHTTHRAQHALTGMQARSMYMFGINNPFRKICSAVVEMWVFDGIILCCIVASCVLLAWEGPPEKMESSKWKDPINTANFVFCIIFAVEACMKIVASGFILRSHPTKTPYLKDGLNKLDFFVVVTISFSYVMLFFEVDAGSANYLGRTLRVLRVLAPIRIAMRSERMRIITRAFILSVLPTSAVFGVVTMFLVMFASVGTELFKNSLRRCCDCSDFLNVVRTMTNGTTITTQEQCLADGFCWLNPAYNFDTAVDSLQTLFKTMTTHGWVDIMESVADSNGEGFQPSKDAFIESKAFFIVFHVVVTFFMLNLLVGVMASSFSEANKTNLFTDKQKEWVREKATLAAFTPRENQDWPESVPFYTIRKNCKDVADNEAFDNLVVLAILLNVCVLAMEHYPMSEWSQNLYTTANTSFLAFFTVEIFIKMIGYGAKRYFRDGFAFMDLAVVGACWASLLVGVRSGLEVLRVCRVFRVFLVLNHFEGLMALFSTVMHSIPAAVDVCLISILLFFIYAIIGMTLFGDVETLDCDVLCPGRLNRADNFSDFFHAMQLLFQTSAGQCIYNLMHDLERSGSGKLLVFFYFASFKFMADFVFVNLIVGIILDTFDNTFSTEEPIFHADDLWAFRERWKEHAVAYAEDLGLCEADLVRIRKNPSYVPLPMQRIRTLIEQLVADNTLRVGGDVQQWRCYLMLQLQLWATASKRKALVPLKTHSAEPVSANGSNGTHTPASPKALDSPESGKKKLKIENFGFQSWLDVFPTGGLDFYKSMMRVVQFELGPDAIFYAERMKEQELLSRTVATEMVQAVVRAWFLVATSRLRPDSLPEEWRDKPQLFAKCVIGFRNARLEVLARMQRYISGKQSVTAVNRLRKQEEKLSKIDKMRQSALVNTVKTLDVTELGSSLVANTAELGALGSSLVANTAELGATLVKDGSPKAIAGRMTTSHDSELSQPATNTTKQRADVSETD